MDEYLDVGSRHTGTVIISIGDRKERPAWGMGDGAWHSLGFGGHGSGTAHTNAEPPPLNKL